MSINRAISRLAAVFLVAYAILFARQLYVQVIAGPRLAADPHNPRAASLAAYRGTIVARDGTILARSSARGRRYPLGAAAAHAVGYASSRFGTSGLEAAYDAALSGHAVANDPFAEIGALFHERQPVAAIRGATVVTTLDPKVQAALYGSLSNYSRGAGVAL
ncbi:MAG: cell division protein FtsI, partial [Candidatus Eremiobacteraeota bacterium]|nr:cell division protein FtsI [Candidatus Eremiobacteraeota bacterium]